MLHFEGGNRGFRLPITETIADTYHDLQTRAVERKQVDSTIHWLEANLIGLVVLTIVLAVVAGLGWTAVLVAPIAATLAIVTQWLLVE